MDLLVQTASGAIENPLHALDLTLPDESLTLNVPEAWASGWLLEASPSPLFTPAAGQLGVGSQASISKGLLNRMRFLNEEINKLNAVYVRLGPAAKTREALQVFKVNLN